MFSFLLSFPGLYLSIPGSCHLSTTHSSSPGVALMGPFPRLTTLWSLVRCAPMSLSLWRTCLQKVVNCTSCPRTWFHSYVWLSTWCSLTFFSPDTRVIHLNWKIALGILYTAWHLASLRFSVPLPCFCGALFFYCPLAQSILS